MFIYISIIPNYNFTMNKSKENMEGDKKLHTTIIGT